MKLMSLTIVLFICISLCLTGQTVELKYGKLEDSKKFSEAVYLLETWIQSVLDFDRLPGVSIAIVYDQDIVYSKGFGYADLKKGIKAEPDTYYPIGSISKQFTAISIMQLRDKGKLKLTDSVSKYLPWFEPETDQTNVSQPTIGDLLRHSSGLPCEPDLTIWSNPTDLFPSREEFIKRVKNIKMSYQINTQFNYSNTGYALLGEIVSVVSNIDYSDFVQHNILEPLNLENTIPNSPDKFRKNAAIGYGRWPRKNVERIEISNLDPRAMAPAGGFISTVIDIAKFAMWQFRVLNGQDPGILKRETLMEMQSVQWENPKWGYGYTYWYLDDLDIIGHQGSVPGYRSQIILSPKEKIAVVVMFNAHDAPQWGTAMETYNIIARALRTPNHKEKEKKTAGWEKYIGYYTADRSWAEAEVLEWEGALSVMWLPVDRPIDSLIKLSHIERNVFREVRNDSSLGKHYVFGSDSEGNIVSMKFNNNILNKTVR